MTRIRFSLLLWTVLALVPRSLPAATITPGDLTAPFGVQPFVGLIVTGGVTEPFFSDLSGLPFPGPAIVDIVAGLQAFDPSANPIGTFSVTGVTVTQGAATVSPSLDNFDLASPVTYTSTLNPLSQVTVNPGDLNLGFIFNSDASLQYSYTLSITGVPDGGFVLYNDVEGALVPEPFACLPLGAALAAIGWRKRRRLV